MQEQTKIKWMQQELSTDGFEGVSESTIESILAGEDNDNDALVDYVLGLADEWATEGNV